MQLPCQPSLPTAPKKILHWSSTPDPPPHKTRNLPRGATLARLPPNAPQALTPKFARSAPQTPLQAPQGRATMASRSPWPVRAKCRPYRPCRSLLTRQMSRQPATQARKRDLDIATLAKAQTKKTTYNIYHWHNIQTKPQLPKTKV